MQRPAPCVAFETGPTGAETSSQVELALGPYLMLAAAFPLLLLLVRTSR